MADSSEYSSERLDFSTLSYTADPSEERRFREGGPQQFGTPDQYQEEQQQFSTPDQHQDEQQQTDLQGEFMRTTPYIYDQDSRWTGVRQLGQGGQGIVGLWVKSDDQGRINRTYGGERGPAIQDYLE